MMNTQKWQEFVNGVSAKVNELIEETREMGPSFLQTGLFEVQGNPDDLIYRTEGGSGFNYLEQFGEDGSIKYDETDPQYQTEYVMKQFGKGVRISQLLMKTRPQMLETKLGEVKEMRIAANRTLNKHAWQVLNDGFVDADSNASLPISRLADGVSQFNASHPSKVDGVAVRSNRISGDGLLTADNLDAAEKQLKEMLNGRGLPIAYEGNFTLVVPPALKNDALRLTKSDLQAGTANNDINVFKGIMDVVVSVYLGAANGGLDTQWFLIASDAPKKPMTYVSLIDPKIEQDNDFDTKAIKVSVDGAWAFGYSNFEYAVGSDGTDD